MATASTLASMEAALPPGSSQIPVAAPRPGRAKAFLYMLGSNRKAAIGVALLFIFGLVAVIGPWIAPYDPAAVGPAFNLTPSWTHWLGTTQLGEDVLSQLLAGARPTITYAVLAGLIATAISCLFGLTAGYARGVVDDFLSLIINVVLILPTLPVLIVVAAYANQLNVRGSLIQTIVIAATAWPWGARVLRSQMLSLRQKDFVLASRVAGESAFRTVWDEILPNMTSLVVANFIGATLYALLFGVALQYLGLTDESQVSWGTMLYWAENGDGLILGMWTWFIPVGLCIALFGTGLVFTNYAIDELTNPRLRTQKVRRRAKPTKSSWNNVSAILHEPSDDATPA
ncbi:MAG TPA: ABC transporter permease [Chloroflexota bacterium]|jgi:peptide/nickel transport system permease protein|nr:ABC transporter permease [Chloroflexota bacterium]